MAKTPWGFSKHVKEGDENVVPNLPTPQGEELGRELARITKKELERQSPGTPPPCDECAFVRGTIPNGCPSTLMDAVKCIVEGEPFYCHKSVKPTERPRVSDIASMSVDSEPAHLCRGFAALMGAQERLGRASEKAGSKDALMSKRCDHGSEFEWAPVAGAWRIDRRPGCRCWWPEPASPEERR
jgi:hypothetical protein